MKTLLASFVIFGVVSIGSDAFAQSRCPADDMGCTSNDWQQKVNDRIDQGKQEVWEADGVRDRVNAVGSTVRDCVDCGMKVITDGIEGGSISE